MDHNALFQSQCEGVSKDSLFHLKSHCVSDDLDLVLTGLYFVNLQSVEFLNFSGSFSNHFSERE